MQELVGQFKYDYMISLRQAMGAVNMSNHYATAKDFAKAEIKYQYLQELANQFKQNLDIALQQSKGAVNLALSYCRQSEWEAVRLKIDQAIDLANNFEKNESINIQTATAISEILLFSREKSVNVQNRHTLVSWLSQSVQTFQLSTIWEERLPFLKETLQDELVDGK